MYDPTNNLFPNSYDLQSAFEYVGTIILYQIVTHIRRMFSLIFWQFMKYDNKTNDDIIILQYSKEITLDSFESSFLFIILEHESLPPKRTKYDETFMPKLLI
jgi:hypothetical protein